MNWLSINTISPPKGRFLNTKISDKDGERNFQMMKFEKNLWWSEDGMYVYYTPTHWAEDDDCC